MTILLFNPANGRIQRLIQSANTLDYRQADQVTPKPGVLEDPVLPDGWSPFTHIVDNGQVRAYTQAELDAAAVAAAQAAAQAAIDDLAGRKAWAKDQIVAANELRELTEALLETVMTLVVPQLNTLRAQHGLAALTTSQVVTATKAAFKTAYEGKIDSWT